MAIISVMLPDELAEELDRVVSSCGYASRSEAVRHALRAFLADLGVEYGGFTTAVVVAVYERAKARSSLRVQHDFTDIIHTLIHAHMDDGACLDVVVVRGDAKRIGEFASRLRSQKGVKYVRYMAIPPA